MTAYNHLFQTFDFITVTQTPSSLSPLHPSTNSKLKRGIDIFGALVGLGITVIIAIPIMMLMAISDPGPLLYTQVRCGLYSNRI